MVVVVVGVVHRHLLDARGDAPHRLHVRLWGRPTPRPSLFAPPSPHGSHALSCLSPRAHGALALALGSLPRPHAFVPLSVLWALPPVICALACPAGARILPVLVSMPLAAPTLADRVSPHSMCSVAARFGALLAPLRALPVPVPFPGSLSCVVPPAAHALSPSAAAGLRTLSALSPSLLATCAQACPLRLSLGIPPVASCPPLRAPVAGTLPRLRAVRPFPDHAPGVRLPPQLRQRDAGRRTLGRRGADVPRPPRREWFGGERLGSAGVGVGGVGVGAVLDALPAHCCCCGGPRRGALGPRGVCPPSLWRAGGRSVTAGAVARLAGALVLAPRAPSPLSSAAAVAPGEATRARAVASPRAGGASGAAVRSAAWLAGAAVEAPCAPGAPSGGGAAGIAACAAGAASSPGAGPRVDGPVSAEAARGCQARGPAGTAASASRRSSRSARISPVHPGETGERKRDRRWWRWSRWG